MDRSSHSARCSASCLAIVGFLLLLPRAAPATDWLMFQTGPGHAGITADTGPASFNVRWKVRTEEDVNGQAAVAGGRVYVVNEDGVLYCLNAGDGAIVWAMSGYGGDNKACPAVVDGKVYLGKGPNNDGLVCRQASDGKKLWEEARFGSVAGPVTVADGKVFYSTLDDYVVCLNASDGALIWWHDAGEQMWPGPAVDVTEGRVYVGTTSHHLICLPIDEPAPVDQKLTNSDRKWVFAADQSIYGTPSLYRGGDAGDKLEILFGDASGRVYHLRDDGGSHFTLWTTTSGGDIQGSVAVNSAFVWVGAGDDSLYSFWRNGGGMHDSYPFATAGGWVYSSPVVAGAGGHERVYFTAGADDWALFCLDADTGDLIWKDESYLYMYSSPTVADGILYVGDGGTEYVLAIGPSSGSASTQAAFPVGRNDASGEDTIRVVFDRPVDSSALTLSNYLLAPSGIVVGAAFDPVDASVVHLAVTGAPAAGDTAQLTVSNVSDLATGTPMPIPQTCTFWMGIQAVGALQAADPVALAASPCEDRSRFAGSNGLLGNAVTFRGTCAAIVGGWYYLVDPAGGQRSGIRLAAPIVPLTVGRQYLVAGRVHESSGETAVSGNYYLRDEGEAVGPLPDPILLPVALLADVTCDVSGTNTNGEDYEGMLVQIENARVVADEDPGHSFQIAAPYPNYNGTLLVDNDAGVIAFDPGCCDVLNVTGVLRMNSERACISPRSDADIVWLSSGAPADRVRSSIAFSVAPNPGPVQRLSFTLSRRAEVELSVFDVAGRELKVLARGTFEAGFHDRLVWDGTGANGDRVGAGLFFHRLRVDGETHVVRGVRLD